MAKKRRLNIFTLSFLDVMAGGFGAVVILFLIINHAIESDEETVVREILSESRLLDFREQQSLEDLAALRERVAELTKRLSETKEVLKQTTDEVNERNATLDEMMTRAKEDKDTLEQIELEIDRRRKAVEKLQQNEDSQESTIYVAGQGDRQYLTGLFLGGRHILIALDASASMLDDTIVNVLRRRNMAVERQLESPKWQRAIRTVEWLVANIPLDSQFQIAKFNNETEFVVGNGSWLDASNGDLILEAVNKLSKTPPEHGTNLYKLFTMIGTMRPMPDNVLLVIDSLPTQGQRESTRSTISGRQRLSLFNQAVAALPANIPINVILFPMEGDPFAAGSYWNLAQTTSGTFIVPSVDWP